ncbi:MAG: nucleotidyl transferase AbiEii/AbiGii toxin family protein [Chlamydiota bacterium]
MNLFDKLVDEALKKQPDLVVLRMVVEKELLQHDILRILSTTNLLKNLTFIGGTCLRLCYGGVRLSEDLDFTGGLDFSRSDLSSMGKILTEMLYKKYGLHVFVSEPIKDKFDVDTWKVKVETNPGTKHLPAQRINIDICSLPSYEKKPMLLINPYGVDMGTTGLIVQAQSREELFSDKLIAFALRPNRIKYRDLWDIMWLHGKGIHPRIELIPKKLLDRKLTMPGFLTLFEERRKTLSASSLLEKEFKQEMGRFLPFEQFQSILKQEGFWTFICNYIEEIEVLLKKSTSIRE